eukprot:12165586-Alexandrium_andersonii.AAC.1
MHELTHMPFQPWCEECVRNRASQPPHHRANSSAARPVPTESRPVVQADYAYFTELGGWSSEESSEAALT